MYSRDIFQKYASGGMPIPENYSGNAIRRASPRQSSPPRPTAPPPSGASHASVPLTVSPSFAARQHPTDMPREQVTPLSQTESIERGEGAGQPHREDKSERSAKMPQVDNEKKEEALPASASPASTHDGGFSSLLSTLLPPKPGVGGLFSQIGLEEALLLGLFLLLSQSDEEQDTLVLLALLFLYR